MSERRKRELEAEQKRRASALAQQKLAQARVLAQLELELPLLNKQHLMPKLPKSMLEQHQATLIHRGPMLGTLVNKMRTKSNRNQ